MVEFKKANIKMASQNASNIVFRKDYTAPDHQIDSLDLSFDLIPTCTEVTSKIIAVPQEDRKSDDLILDGDDLTLVSIKIAGEDSFPGQYDMRPGKLIIHNIKERTEIEIVTRINPRNNLELSGLYMSKNNYITQCEAEGFRRITYFPDRPDILAKYRVVIRAPKDYKVLLSNGNLIEQGELLDGRNYAIWEDPFPKPSYLFALVAFSSARTYLELKMFKPLFSMAPKLKSSVATIMKRSKSRSCDDFLNAMAESNYEDLSQFELWYSQAGTPRISVETKWDEIAKTFTLTLRQNNRTFPGKPAPKPLMIPVKIGILDDAGNDIPLQLKGKTLRTAQLVC